MKYIYKNTGMIVESDMVLDPSIFEPVIEKCEADQDAGDNVFEEHEAAQDTGDGVPEESVSDQNAIDGIPEDPSSDQKPVKAKTTRKTAKKAAI